MKSVSFEELATITYVLTDDWYQKEGKNLVRETVGQKPVFSNSEVLTLLLLIKLFAISRRRAIFWASSEPITWHFFRSCSIKASSTAVRVNYGC